MPLDHIEFAMFDMAGTTVDDRLMGPSLVVTAFVEAFAGAGFTIAPEQVHQHRGKDKREAIHSLLRELVQHQPTLKTIALRTHLNSSDLAFLSRGDAAQFPTSSSR